MVPSHPVHLPLGALLIWCPMCVAQVASVHDPYSFRGPEDKSAKGGASRDYDLQQNGAPKGWSAPLEGAPSVNQDENCSIM